MPTLVNLAPKRMKTKEILVPFNQLHIELPTDGFAALLQKYSIWRYQLSEQQSRSRFSDREFYSRFTNDYKNKFDQPFYFFTYNKPYAALYTLLPAGEVPRPWLYPFGDPRQVAPAEVQATPVAPDELKPQVLLKLLLALCFFENGTSDRERRVCQSKFYLQLKSRPSGKYLTAVELQPIVDEQPDRATLTLKVEANTFVRIEPAQAGSYAHLGAYFELFESHGHTYLRQLRPNQVATFVQPLYQQRTFSGKRTQADWHHNGSRSNPLQYQESRSYQVRHVQERFSAFLRRYGFRVALAEELMHRQAATSHILPLHRLPTVQVVDNRLNTKDVPALDYLAWLNTHEFKQGKAEHYHPFELVAADKVDAARPLLALLDADRSAFETPDKQLALLAQAGHQDPYQQLYQQLPAVVKQSLNVNPNEAGKFVVPADYLTYPSPVVPPADSAETSATAPNEAVAEETAEAKKNRLATAKQAKVLALKLDVCLTELWLKWVLAGKDTSETSGDSLPLLAELADEWGFITDNMLLYFQHGTLQFADLDTPEGKQLLKARFTSWSELKQRFFARQPRFATAKPGDEKAELALRKAHFVLVGREAFELAQTETIALPNWPVIKALKAVDPAVSAKSLLALNVYAGGVWYDPQARRYLVSGATSSQLAEPRGHHLYQIHATEPIEPAHLRTLLALLTVKFVRRNQFTVWPYPFDLLRLHQEMSVR